ncbi:MAG TPA: LytTR family DNA-binding domain-containing protein [bacterium]|nr:LytTR family DNA-binding domain-containing protein [bacterium]HMW31954.1 LytTR family DNA-binding domain-containing protein [bacterium]HMY34997.1 LytTR family DNA-binding domain-containing protein [bacterium]HMZ05269.1 LytTR family DNA-binding domain-containing protein [bacterium]HNB08822.1 LytTR family DNA-binding domain-containing protein [bacterium]
MNALIVDDERLAREELRRLLSSHPDIKIVGEARHAEEARELIATLRPDLVFLDIQMPGEDGFALLASLESTPEIIFTTAYDQFALKAFEVNALDYLLKPIDPKRLADALQKISSQESSATPTGPLTDNDQVFVKDGDRCWFVRLKQIRLMESEGNYTRLYFDKEKPLILRSLNQLEVRLDPKVFFRASRQHIINMQWIETIEPWFDGGLNVTLKSGPQVKISRRQAQKFRELTSL